MSPSVRLAVCLAVAVVSSSASSSSQASVWYSVGTSGADASSDIYVVTNITNGAILKIGESGRSLTDAAFDADSRRLFGVDVVGQLYEIDLGTGAASRLSPASQTTIYALEYCAGKVYGWGPTLLVSYDTSTGIASAVGPVGFGASGDLACASDGTLYGTARASVSGQPDSLVRIDRATGVGTLVGVMDYPQVFGLDFDLDGTLYAATQPTASGGVVQFMTVNPASGKTLELLGTQSSAVGMYGFAIDTEDGTGCALLESPHTWYYRDEDNDGFGTSSGLPEDVILGCLPPQGFVTNDDDCEDLDDEINPLAEEICDGIDNDCDGASDIGAIDASVWYRDADGDGFGAGSPVYSCAAPLGYVNKGSDCNDSASSVYPGAAEVCNAIDDDCDGAADDGLGFVTYYRDVDRDGYGNAADAVTTCGGIPSGYVVMAGDCNDQDSSIHPGIVDGCDGIDNDCDALLDEDGGAVWHRDADLDGYGRPDTSMPGDVVTSCTQPFGYSGNTLDCNDEDPSTYPGAIEQEDGKDNDCDGQIDEESPTPTPVVTPSLTPAESPTPTPTASPSPTAWPTASPGDDESSPTPAPPTPTEPPSSPSAAASPSPSPGEEAGGEGCSCTSLDAREGPGAGGVPLLLLLGVLGRSRRCRVLSSLPSEPRGGTRVR